MSIRDFIKQLKEAPGELDFSHSLAIIDENYHFTPVAFKNGVIYNKAGENNGSCKIFYFSFLNELSEKETLSCFGEHYREVQKDEQGTGHQNIRNFMKTGWDRIKFDKKALLPK